MIKSNFELENKFLADGYDFVIGIDEAGRGPLAGPVTAAAVAWRKFQITNNKFQINSNNQISNDKNFQKNLELIRDSKTLSEKQRESLFDFIQENFYVGVGICDHNTIDRANILEASFLAMKSAVSQLKSKIKSQNSKLQFKNQNLDNFENLKTIILLDGNKNIPNLSIEQKCIVSGDKIVKSISAASIIAKVTRDRIMLEMHEKYPEYCFDKHKGYGTKLHMDMLQKHGPCNIHRRSFDPVKKALKKIVNF